jgi:choline dehydrogenase-like flavoprotein
VTTGRSLASSSLYDAGLWYSTGLGDEHTHDAQIGFLVCGYTPELWRTLFRVDTEEYFEDAAATLADDAEVVVILANPVQPHSEGEVRLASADPLEPPIISLNYFSDPHDVKVMVAIMRRALELVEKWPVPGMGPLHVPPKLAESHGHKPGDTPTDELLEDLARHYALTVYHATSTCRIGSVVDTDLRVLGVARLRVADASVMPNVTSGNTNAPTIMIGEKAAELIAEAHGLRLTETVGAG